MKTIVLANQKGGVGKSTIATHLAMAFHEKNNRVLFIDLDTQANSTKTLLKSGCISSLLSSQLFLNNDLSFRSENTITLIAADIKLADLERADVAVISYFKRQLHNLKDHFDYCVIDTPPTLGIRMTSALIAADFVLSPIELEEYSIDGVHQMLQTIYGVKQKWNLNLQFLGMLANRFNARSEIQKGNILKLLEDYAHLIIPARISMRSSIPEALASGLPVWQLKKTAAREAAKEFQDAFNLIFEKMETIAA
ncbi:MAG: ParA family protein [Pseudomonadota bacterium]